MNFDLTKLLCELLGRLLVQRFPELATMERRKEGRSDQVYVAIGQTGRSRTIVSPYSVRAVSGATVSTPLQWEEVHRTLDPKKFHLESVPERADTLDPWAEFFEQTPNPLRILRRIEEWSQALTGARPNKK